MTWRKSLDFSGPQFPQWGKCPLLPAPYPPPQLERRTWSLEPLSGVQMGGHSRAILWLRMLPPLPVRAVPAKTKPLPMEQLQVIQSFLHAVPQGRKMVEEVSEGLGTGSAGSSHTPWWGPFLPGDPLLSFTANHSLHLLLSCLPPSSLGPAPSLPLSPCPCPGPGTRWTEPSLPVLSCTT